MCVESKNISLNIIVLARQSVPALYFYDMKHQVNIMYRGIFEISCPLRIVTDRHKPNYVYIIYRRYDYSEFVIALQLIANNLKKDDWVVRIEGTYAFPLWCREHISMKLISLTDGCIQVGDFFWILPPYLFEDLSQVCHMFPPVILRLILNFAHMIDGYPFTHEWVFYVFESLPMLPAISVFCVYHPARYLGRTGGLQKRLRKESGVELLRV